MSGTLVLLTQSNLTGIGPSTELLAWGQALRDRVGSKLKVALVGREVSQFVSRFRNCADEIFVAEHDLLGRYSSDLHLSAAEQVCRQVNPQLILVYGDSRGQALSPRLAHRLDTELIIDCISVEIDEKSGAVLLSKPVYGGKAIAVFQVNCSSAIISVRPRLVDTNKVLEVGKATVRHIDLDLTLSMMKSRVVEHRTEEFAVELETANIVIAGGRGVGGPEGFELLRELSQVLGAALGASGAACNAGWVPSSWQIGQTGKKVSPDLYFAIGISGASQHVAGFSQAKHVVAINKDEDAPIFKTAELGIVDDFRRIVPLLTRKLGSRREHSADLNTQVRK